MNTALLIFLSKLVLGTGFLYLLYTLLLKKRLDGNTARFFLLGGTLLFTLLPFLPFAFPAVQGDYLIILPEITSQTAAGETRENQSGISVFALLYGIPVIVGFILFVIKLFKLIRFVKQSKKQIMNGYPTYFSTEIQFPFSFGKHIFIPENLNGEQLAIVLLHEQAHIRHAHTADILCFEVLKIVGWFNPFYYLLERELRQAHEFTADEWVLKTGTGVPAYCETLLSCALAGMHVPVNYFKGSQIKSRIQMMNKPKNRTRSLALLTLALALGISGAAFSPNVLGQSTPITALNEVDKIPEFPGGQTEMAKFIGSTLVYPETAKKAKTEGVVYIEFTVDMDGSLKDISVKKGIGNGCDEAALSTVKKMPNWIPAEKDGKKVAVQMVLPIRFAME